MGEEVTKLCKMCCKPIPIQARKCPHCQQMQGALSAFLLHPAGQVALAFGIVGIGGAICIGVLALTLRSHGRSAKEFNEYTGQVEVADARIEFGVKNGEPIVAVLGVIDNRSDVTWFNPLLSVVIRDVEGKMTDAQQVRGPRMAPRQNKAPFSVSMPRQFEEGRYVKTEVRILGAFDSDRAFFD